jgi:hypothetical protein
LNAQVEQEQAAVEAVDVKTLNVYQRLNEIKKAVTFIVKGKKVESYMAVTHDAVTALTHDHFVQWRVLPEPHEVSSVTVDTKMTTGKGIPYVRFEGRYRVDFVNIDKPEERACVELTSHALDHGDKSPGKGLSYATKAAILKILQLESGEKESDEERAEDVKVEGKKDQPKLPTKSMSGTDGAVEKLSPERREVIARKLSSVVDCFEAGQEEEGYKVCKEVTDADESVALWHMLKPHSKIRRRITEMSEVKRKLEGKAPPARDPAAHRRD